ncbi:hypothetical protein OUZ56_026811 [Daphnia magna]|uniref:Glypican-5 n=1 Tax=Daphnia magna TaxID=35525 RepID=A0ABQ9ZMW1_9CRUS|nr:hypothetical protein OUZ56_026811 [Daphnia magna]
MVKTQTMFGQLYKRLALLAKEPIQQLFDQLERFVSSSADGMGGDPADVSDAVNGFFDDLFPRLYGQSPRSVQEPPLPADSVGQRLPQDYVDCLRHAQSELRPFGEIPRRLANSLARSLDAVRSLLSALDLGARVLNATDHVELNSQCRDALLRATYCAQCRALKRQQPIVVGSGGQVCSGLCSNVARGCLAAVADVDQPWNEWVDAMERLAAALLNKAGAAVADLGPHDILSSVDSRLSEAVLYALENGPLLEKKRDPLERRADMLEQCPGDLLATWRTWRTLIKQLNRTMLIAFDGTHVLTVSVWRCVLYVARTDRIHQHQV